MLICSHIELSLLLYRLAVANLTTERDSSLQQLADCVADRDSQVKQARKLAQLVERGLYSRKVDHININQQSKHLKFPHGQTVL